MTVGSTATPKLDCRLRGAALEERPLALSPNWSDPLQAGLKRALDILLSSVLLILLSPVMLAVGVIVALSSPGGVLYRRRVVGTGGEFDAYKFRTMRADADEVLRTDSILRDEFENNYKLKNDPRITKVGAQLRRFSLDELPQLINVLRGEMSLVGPRMITSSELKKHRAYEGFCKFVKPGLTGYWQVNGRQEVKYSVRVEMDTYYVEKWSLELDLRILLKTARVVITAKGAY